MITLEDYENLLKYFEENPIPDNLVIFIEKLKIMRDEILFRKDAQDKLKEFQDRLAGLSANDEKED